MAVTEDRRERCDGCGRETLVAELTAISLEGDTLACCETCAPHIEDVAASIARTDSCDGCGEVVAKEKLAELSLPDGTLVDCCADCREEWERRDRNDTETDIAPQQDRCSQCHEPVEEEPYEVTTIDGRTEELCPSCRDRAERKGVISEVAMRRTEAREILGVGPGADPDEIQKAFRRQIQRAHPDRPSGSESAFKLVKRAYDRLR